MKTKSCELIMTVKEMQDRDTWLKIRTSGIGGSDAGTIMGSDPWKSPYQLWLEKTGQVESEDISNKGPVYWGTKLEPLIARKFAEETGKKVERLGMLRHISDPWMLANVDRMVMHEDAGLEIKTTNAFRASDWDGDNLPDSYYWQCQHYMMCTGMPLWYIAVLIGGQDFRWKEVPRCQEDIDELYKRERAFWTINVQQHLMPEIDGSQMTKDALIERYPGGGTDMVDLPKEMDLLLAMRSSLTEDIDDREVRLQQINNKIMSMMGDNEVGMTPAGARVTWRPQAGRTTIDSKKLAKDWPEAYEACKKVGKPIRVLRIKEADDNGND